MTTTINKKKIIISTEETKLLLTNTLEQGRRNFQQYYLGILFWLTYTAILHGLIENLIFTPSVAIQTAMIININNF